MSTDEPTPPRKFTQTDWGLVGRAAGEGEAGRDALGTLLVRYLPALQAHLIQCRGLSPDDADDMLQEFVASKILEGAVISRARRDEGKFRTFLLKTLNRFVMNQVRDRRAKKRSPGQGRITSLDADTGLSPSETQPVDAFHAAWAHEVISDALRRMEIQCERSGRSDLWAIFRSRVVDPIFNGENPTDYGQLIEQTGFCSPAQASNALVTAKRMYARVLRSVLAAYARDEQEIEEEITELREALSRGGPSRPPA